MTRIGISLYEGKLWSLKEDLMSKDSVKISSQVIMVHGFRYDPLDKGDNNPHNTTFPEWRKNIIQDASAFGFGWWSCPGGKKLLSSTFKAFRAGRWNTYRYGWDLAEEAGEVLAKIISRSEKPVTLLCHSLGSRVVMSAIAYDKTLPIKRVVLMNGAELKINALYIAKERSHIKFYNLVVRGDDMLSKFGALFAPGDLYSITVGQAGLGNSAPRNWEDINMDSPLIKRWATIMGWPDVQGNNPRGYFDHWWTIKHPGNWPLIRALLFDNGIVIPKG